MLFNVCSRIFVFSNYFEIKFRFLLAKKYSEQNMMTEKELDEFLTDLTRRHGLKTIYRALKSK